MRSKVAILLCLFVLAACRKSEDVTGSGRHGVLTKNIPQDASGKRASVIDRVGTAVIEKMLVGSQLGPDGTVTEEKKVFAAGDPVYLTLRLHDSPVGLRTGAIWYDGNEKPIVREQKEMNGTKVATFSLNQKLAPGKYHVTGYWGGNIADDRPFEVVPRAKRSK